MFYKIRIGYFIHLLRQDKVVHELLQTEQKYVDDLSSILVGYRDRMFASSTSMGHKAEDIFGNIEDVFAFHSQSLLPELERYGENSQMIARTFIDLSKDMERIYSRYGSLELRYDKGRRGVGW